MAFLVFRHVDPHHAVLVVEEIFAQRFSSQPRNREDARERLAALIAKAQQREKPRRPTKPTKASKTRRLDEKSRRGAVKALRGKTRAD